MTATIENPGANTGDGVGATDNRAASGSPQDTLSEDIGRWCVAHWSVIERSHNSCQMGLAERSRYGSTVTCRSDGRRVVLVAREYGSKGQTS